MGDTSNRQIRTDSIENDQVKRLISHHLEKMKQGTPPESVHALGYDELKKDDITLWTLWIDDKIAGCGALKELSPLHGEVKSMRTDDAFLRKGVAQKLLGHIIDEARQRGYARLSLETGAAESFYPAHKLYKKKGFIPCEPFGS